jgi:hypothetical protein
MNTSNQHLNFFSKPLQALITDPSHDAFEARAYLCPANKLTIGYGHVLLPTDAPLFNLEPPQLARMIKECMKRLTPEGILVFSNNKKKFELNRVVTGLFDVKEASNWTIPQDFHHTNIHRSFFIKNRN